MVMSSLVLLRSPWPSWRQAYEGTILGQGLLSSTRLLITMPHSPPSLLIEEPGFLGVSNLTVKPPVRLRMYTGRNGWAWREGCRP